MLRPGCALDHDGARRGLALVGQSLLVVRDQPRGARRGAGAGRASGDLGRVAAHARGRSRAIGRGASITAAATMAWGGACCGWAIEGRPRLRAAGRRGRGRRWLVAAAGDGAGAARDHARGARGGNGAAASHRHRRAARRRGAAGQARAHPGNVAACFSRPCVPRRARTRSPLSRSQLTLALACGDSSPTAQDQARCGGCGSPRAAGLACIEGACVAAYDPTRATRVCAASGIGPVPPPFFAVRGSSVVSAESSGSACSSPRFGLR